MDIDSLSVELFKAMTGKAGSKGHSGTSQLPPKLKSKFYSWMKKMLTPKINILTPAKKNEIYQNFKENLIKFLESFCKIISLLSSKISYSFVSYTT